MNESTLKVSLITGAGRRIGAHIAKTLHQNGFSLILHCHRAQAETETLAGRFNAERPNSAHVISADLRDLRQIKVLADGAVRHWGRMDSLVNNASVFHPTRIGALEEQQWDEIIGVNLKAPLFLIQSLAAALREHKGCIINLLDIHGDRSLKGYPVYCASKAGLGMLTRSLARELAPDVRCNGIAPGAILWPENGDAEKRDRIIARTALKRAGDPGDVARTVLFLIEDAHYITGQTITVDGGRTLSN